MNTVSANSQVEISFKLSIVDGPVVEETEADEVFAFKMGDGTFLPQLEERLVGLAVDTTATFILQPDEAFGSPDPVNVQSMPRTDFPADMQLEEGHVIGFNTPTGEEIPGKVFAINGDEVVIDFNHPLAGQVLEFKVTVKGISE